ncbi:glycoside hydrolase superfamily [Xylariaceae sp. FL0804]|nr:glycoside hydrolase superfamily [Xylariaceae sp. FL0804]
MKLSVSLVAAAQVLGALGLPGMNVKHIADAKKQDIVTWDEHSLFVHGERVMIFSGEAHPYRLPVPSLWSDVFQKVKALGFNCVSFYVDWALLEGKRGDLSADGVFDLQPFFDAAQDAGLYLIARPGPYINAEVSGGGFPGWLARLRGLLRTRSPDYLEATDNYMSYVCGLIAKAQITNGGPVILFQPENEYTVSASDYTPFPDDEYMQYVENQALNAGIVVPLLSNDASPDAHNVPGTGVGQVDIYGHDGYPLGFDCAAPTTWPSGDLPTDYHELHEEQSPTTPYSITEFQGGSFDPWGGYGFEMCAALLNMEFERVFYKNNYAAGVAIMNLYMIFGGTNWGNLGHPGGYTSYDYGAAIKEDRTVTREKYSELKLQATFMSTNIQYLTTSPGNATVGVYSSNADITVTPLLANQTFGDASFFVVRHTDYSSTASTEYTVTLPTSEGDLSLPRTSGTLTLMGRDSKMMATDYDVQGARLLYTTADIFTDQKSADGAVLVVYAETGEYNEFSLQSSGTGVKTLEKGGDYTVLGGNSSSSAYVTVGWTAAHDRSVFQIGNVTVYALNRNSAYNYWVTNLGSKNSNVVINGPYLVRSANLSQGALSIKADFNKSAPVEIISAPSAVSKLSVNDKALRLTKSGSTLTAHVNMTIPDVALPDLSKLTWHSIDSLPEIQSGYDDSKWTKADILYSNNTYQPLIAPVSTYASDYGYHTGVLVYRGHFNSSGTENSFSIYTEGGDGYGSSVWLDDTFIGSWLGDGGDDSHGETYTLNATLEAGSEHVFTVVVDQTGHDENYDPGANEMSAPRGVVGWSLNSYTDAYSTGTWVDWKLTGNLGGEDYRSRQKGPLNEGGLYAERQGYHLPASPFASWPVGSPLDGLDAPGVRFYMAELELDLADKYPDWDVPLAFTFGNDTSAAATGAYRAQLYVNGWQFGKLASDVGPQLSFPVPQGILRYGSGGSGGNGTKNYVGLAVWALEEAGARVPSLALTHETPVWTGRDAVVDVPLETWTERPGAY